MIISVKDMGKVKAFVLWVKEYDVSQVGHQGTMRYFYGIILKTSIILACRPPHKETYGYHKPVTNGSGVGDKVPALSGQKKSMHSSADTQVMGEVGDVSPHSNNRTDKFFQWGSMLEQFSNWMSCSAAFPIVLC